MKFLVTQYVLFTATILTNYNYNYLKEAITMKKAILTVASLAVFLSAGSMVSAAAPATEKHEQKMHQHKVHAKHEHKMHAKSKHEKIHKLHAREAAPAKIIGEKSIHAKSLKAKATKLPKTGFGGASEQMN
jgi:hypothetical protein